MRLVIGNKSKYTLGGKSSDNFEKSWNCEIDAGKIENYYLDENEVTCAQFERFISAGDGFQNEKNWPLPDRKNAKDKIRLNQLLSEVGAKDSELLPVTKVTWSEACAYAEWVGKRLPTLLEWEYAVRGDDSPRVSSWSWRESKVTLGEDINIGGLSPWKVSEEKNKDITPELIRNLCSNVSEWTLTSPEVASKGILELDKLLNPIARDLKIWNHEKYWRVGGSFKDDKNTESFSTFNYKRQRNKCEPIENLSETGFRCAMFERDALKIINKGTVKNLGIKKLSLNNK